MVLVLFQPLGLCRRMVVIEVVRIAAELQHLPRPDPNSLAMVHGTYNNSIVEILSLFPSTRIIHSFPDIRLLKFLLGRGRTHFGR